MGLNCKQLVVYGAFLYFSLIREKITDSNPKRNNLSQGRGGWRKNMGRGGGGGGGGEEREIVKGTKTTLFQSLFFFLIDQGHFRNSNTQNEVVLGFPSILIV
jgi:hypothetical protein